jgi:hypothetical protein
MATPAGYKVFVNGDILDADVDVNPYLMAQSVMVFDDAADRTAQLDGDEAEGMVAYLRDTDSLEVYTGAAWVIVNDNTAAILKSIIDAKGDLIAGTAANTPARLAVGTDGQVLTADSTETAGMKWATPAAATSPIGLILALGG